MCQVTTMPVVHSALNRRLRHSRVDALKAVRLTRGVLRRVDPEQTPSGALIAG
jgi:hypothetical protein